MRFSPLLAALIAGGVLMHAAGDAQARKPQRDENPGFGPVVLQPDGFVAAPPRRSLSSDAAARAIQNRHGGRVLAVQPDGEGYRVKLLKDGEVRIYQVDP